MAKRSETFCGTFLVNRLVRDFGLNNMISKRFSKEQV